MPIFAGFGTLAAATGTVAYTIWRWRREHRSNSNDKPESNNQPTGHDVDIDEDDSIDQIDDNADDATTNYQNGDNPDVLR